jgi:hypothetical protein
LNPCLEHPSALVADLGLHVVNAGFQRTVSCYLAVQASGGLYVPWTVNANVLGLGAGRPAAATADIAGFVIRVRPFFFPFATAPTGLWLSPFLQAGVVQGEGLTGLAMAQGVSAGGTFRLGSRVLIAVGVGAQLHVVWFRGSTQWPGFALPGPTVDINASYAF